MESVVKYLGYHLKCLKSSKLCKLKEENLSWLDIKYLFHISFPINLIKAILDDLQSKNLLSGNSIIEGFLSSLE